MKYQPQKSTNLFIAILMIVAAAVLVVAVFMEPHLFSTREALLLIASCCTPLLVISGLFFYYAFRSSAYAMLEDDGIHIYSRKQGELAFIPWTDARDCRQSGVWTASAAMLVFRYDVTVCGKSLATYSGFPHLPYKAARDYILDKLIFRLARGKMTAEELRDLPLLFLIQDGFKSYKKDEFQTYHSMWRAAKVRAAEQEETT